MAAINTSENPLGLLLKAVDFAAKKHSTQRRKDVDKTPYINHPIGVAFILWNEGQVVDLATLQVPAPTTSPLLCIDRYLLIGSCTS